MPKDTAVHVYLTLVSTLGLLNAPNAELERSLRRAWRALSAEEREEVRRLLKIPAGRPARKTFRDDLN